VQTLGRYIDKPIAPSRRTTTHVAASVTAHALLLAAILYHGPVHIAPVTLPGTDHGHNLLLTYLPGTTSAQSTVANPKSKPQPTEHNIAHQIPPQQKTNAVVAPKQYSTETAKTTSTAGNDALGSGNIDIAQVSYFPRPQPSLAALPRGTKGDVILEVVIDETGKISDLKLTSGLGHGIDEAVIATVQQWTFHPATQNGHPVASEQELHFHYEKA
jgi:periplasmic protein TonB